MRYRSIDGAWMELLKAVDRFENEHEASPESPNDLEDRAVAAGELADIARQLEALCDDAFAEAA